MAQCFRRPAGEPGNWVGRCEFHRTFSCLSRAPRRSDEPRARCSSAYNCADCKSNRKSSHGSGKRHLLACGVAVACIDSYRPKTSGESYAQDEGCSCSPGGYRDDDSNSYPEGLLLLGAETVVRRDYGVDYSSS